MVDHIVVHDYNGNALMGAEHGSDCNGGTIVTGGNDIYQIHVIFLCK